MTLPLQHVWRELRRREVPIPEGVDSSSIDEQYADQVTRRTLRYGRIYSLCVLIIAPYMIYQDLVISGLPGAAAFWRVLTMAVSVLFLVLSITPLRRRGGVVQFIHHVNLACLLIMMCGIVYMSVGTRLYLGYLNGIVVTIFVIFIASPGGGARLLPVYLLPFAVFVVAMAVTFDDRQQWLTPLSNPTIMIISLLIFAELQERLRRSEFRAMRIVEYQAAIIYERNELLGRELAQARVIQESLIPGSLPPITGALLHVAFIPMEEVGGDLYDFIALPVPGTVGLFIADVSGHGVPAALVTSMLKALLGTAGPALSSPSSLLSYLNEKTIGKTGGNFITAAYAIYRSTDRTLTFARGGHCLPLLVRGGSVTELTSRGGMIGAFKTLVIEERTVQLQAGDRILFYTDGLIEATNHDGTAFLERLEGQLLPSLTLAPGDDFVAYLCDELRAFCGRSTFDDDVCIVGIEIID